MKAIGKPERVKVVWTNKDVIRIMSVDPGLKNMGICIGDYTLSTNTFTVLSSETWVGDKYLSHDKEMKKKFIRSFCIIQGMKKELLNIFIPTWTPDYIVCEGAFYNASFPSAHQALVLVINLLRECSYIYHQRDIVILPPSVVKGVVTGKGLSGKEAIQSKIKSHSNIQLLGKDTYTEHEFDAIAHGYAFTQLYFTEPDRSQ